MGALASIISFIWSIFGSSAFADALHALLTDLGDAHSQPALDAAMTRAISLLRDGVSFAESAQNLVDSFRMSPVHANVVLAAAQAHIAASAKKTA